MNKKIFLVMLLSVAIAPILAAHETRTPSPVEKEAAETMAGMLHLVKLNPTDPFAGKTDWVKIEKRAPKKDEGACKKLLKYARNKNGSLLTEAQKKALFFQVQAYNGYRETRGEKNPRKRFVSKKDGKVFSNINNVRGYLAEQMGIVWIYEGEMYSKYSSFVGRLSRGKPKPSMITKTPAVKVRFTQRQASDAAFERIITGACEDDGSPCSDERLQELEDILRNKGGAYYRKIEGKRHVCLHPDCGVERQGDRNIRSHCAAEHGNFRFGPDLSWSTDVLWRKK